MWGWAVSVGIRLGWRSWISSALSLRLLLHEVDETEIARAEHDGVLVARPVLFMVAGAAGRFVERLPDRGVVLVAAAHAPHVAPRE